MMDTALRRLIAFRYSPLLDMALSLLIAQDPERFGEATTAWAAQLAERLPPDLQTRLRTLSERNDLFALALELEEREPLPVPALLERLSSAQPKLAEALGRYWNAIAPEVAAQSGLLLESAQAEAADLERLGPLAFIGRFSDRVSVAGDGEALVLHWGKGLRVALSDLDRILFVPSAFCPRRVMFYRVGRVQIFFYAPRQAEPPTSKEVPESLLLAFSALGDATRLRLLRLIAREDLPAQEMAQRLGINESTVSRHLKVLVEAGLVGRGRQDGRFIFYTAQWDRVERLATGVSEYLGRNDG